MYDEQGEKTWDCTLDVYGKMANFEGSSLKECPFRYQGQYEDRETGLYYNRFRYYSAEEGMYLSQDPIGLIGGHNLYRYVFDVNYFVDSLGLSSHDSTTFTDSQGTTLTINGYTDLSHLEEGELKKIYYANTGSGKKGMSPKDKNGNKRVLHHSKQNVAGPIVAMPEQHHNKPHTNKPTNGGRGGQHPFSNKKGQGIGNGIDRKKINNWRNEFWAAQAKAAMKKKGISCNE